VSGIKRFEVVQALHQFKVWQVEMDHPAVMTLPKDAHAQTKRQKHAMQASKPEGARYTGLQKLA
jgi:Co/Zn/Cd efflux system component